MCLSGAPSPSGSKAKSDLPFQNCLFKKPHTLLLLAVRKLNLTYKTNVGKKTLQFGVRAPSAVNIMTAFMTA